LPQMNIRKVIDSACFVSVQCQAQDGVHEKTRSRTPSL